MIRGVAYSSSSKTLYVDFNNGQEYAYSDVPEEEYEALLSAPSVGSYFHDNIRDTYLYDKI